MKKAPGETQTLRAGRSNAEPKNFAPPQPPSRGAGRPKCNQLEMVTTFTYFDTVWWKSMHTISSYRGNTPKQDRYCFSRSARLSVCLSVCLSITLCGNLSKRMHMLWFFSTCC